MATTANKEVEDDKNGKFSMSTSPAGVKSPPQFEINQEQWVFLVSSHKIKNPFSYNKNKTPPVNSKNGSSGRYIELN